MREAGETEEQYEERVLNRRAAQLFTAMRPKLAAHRVLDFADLAPRHNNRKQVRNVAIVVRLLPLGRTDFLDFI